MMMVAQLHEYTKNSLKGEFIVCELYHNKAGGFSIVLKKARLDTFQKRNDQLCQMLAL